MPSQVHSCLADALYHLLVQAVNVRICINAVRGIMLFEGDTPIEIAEAFVTGYSCTLKPCTEEYKKEGGPELHLLKQQEGFFLVLLDVHNNDLVDRHAVAYDGSYVLDNGQCASLASSQPPSPPLPRTASRAPPPAHDLPRSASRAPLASLTACLSLGRVQA